MTIEEAKAIIEKMGPKYVNFEDGDTEAILDDWFTAEQLEAIAMWIRNPKEIGNPSE